MPSPLRPDQRRFPLHIHISVMFTFLLLLTGAVLGIFNYGQTTQIILSSSEKLFNRIEQDVRLDLQGTYEPIRHLLSLLADYPATRAPDLEQRLALLQPFSQSLNDNPNLASLYLGYGNGDFFMVRPLRTASLRTELKAPDSAAFQVWSIEHSSSGQIRSQSLFFDQSLTLINRLDNPDETFDPRTRAWFSSARGDVNQITTDPYVFFSTRNVGTTLARRSGENAVMGADLTLAELSATLAKHVVTPHTEIVLFDAQGNAIAYPDSDKLIIDGQIARLNKAADLSPGLGALLSNPPASNRLDAAGRQWIVARSSMTEGGPQGLQLALLVPEDELLADAYRMRWQGALITLATLLLCLPVGWLTSRVLVKPLRTLVQEADAVRSFNFDFPIGHSSPVLEIDQLSVSMARMKDTLGSFFQITDSLSAETRFAPLLERVLFETVKIGQAQAGLIYLRERDSDRMEPQGLVINGTSQALPSFGVQGHELQDPQSPQWLQQLSTADNIVTNLGFEQAGDLQKVMLALEYPRVHLIGIRLHNRHNETVGLLILLLTDSGTQSDLEKLRPDRIAFLQAVSGAAAVSIESQRLQAKQKQLLDAFIQLLAGAIDAKSPYTGGHCQRVPELTLMLAQAAAASQAPAFSDYQPTEDEWEALHIAAWLHDCGKVTTPEYVVDKATKLETLNDRIHEIRTRFEVLKRDAWINYWQAVALGGDEQHLAELRNANLAGLDDDFAFVAPLQSGRRGHGRSRSATAAQHCPAQLDPNPGRSNRCVLGRKPPPGTNPGTDLAGQRAAVGGQARAPVRTRRKRTDSGRQSLGFQARCAALQIQPRRALQPEHHPRHADPRGALHHQPPHGADDPDAQPLALPRPPQQRRGNRWRPPRENGRHRLPQTVEARRNESAGTDDGDCRYFRGTDRRRSPLQEGQNLERSAGHHGHHVP
ncbi:hypothetical protein OKW12_003352 [Pseudomonas silensiensis]|nr:hypothetical protein [Pseudomonas silensiensis]